MDIHMPGIDGIEATKQILHDELIEQPPYIVALTAAALSEDEERCRQAGMEDFLTKPIRTGDILSVLERYRLRSDQLAKRGRRTRRREGEKKTEERRQKAEERGQRSEDRR
jgi:CheY-like chemotaxis protein